MSNFLAAFLTFAATAGASISASSKSLRRSVKAST